MKLTDLQLYTVFSGFALLLRGGLPLAEGAALLAREEQGAPAAVLEVLAGELDRGERLSRAMEKTGAFPAYAVTMAELGLQTGRPEAVFTRLAHFYREQQLLRDTLRSALIYPGVIFCVMLAVIGVLLIWVLPVFDRVYASLGSGLTGLAGVLLAVGLWLKDSLPLVLVLLVLLLAGGILCLRSPRIREKAAGKLLARFGDRGILRMRNNARFLRGIAMGMGAGVLPPEAARWAAELIRESPMAAARCDRLLEQLHRGDGLPEALALNRFLSEASARMLRLGVRAGDALPVLEDLAEQASREVEAATERALARIEPAMVLTGSVLVGIILLSVMLPLINILSLIG